MCTNGVITESYTQYRETDSSMATDVTAAFLRNNTDVIRENHGVVLAEAARTLKRCYLKTKKYQYKDPSTGELLE